MQTAACLIDHRSSPTEKDDVTHTRKKDVKSQYTKLVSLHMRDRCSTGTLKFEEEDAAGSVMALVQNAWAIL